jgi:4-hydroxy-tetrahydrodipicolinate reductase
MSESIKICLFGATGRMGREIRTAATSGKFPVVISSGIAAADDPHVGTKFQDVEAPILAEWEESCARCDVIVDFSSARGTIAALEAAYQSKKPILVGTTGLPDEYTPIFQKVASVVPVVRAANTSIGITALLSLVNSAAKMLPAGFDAELMEIHHNKKKDAPSGTALALARAVADGRDLPLDQFLRTSREGKEAERKENEITVQSIRGGDVPGDHTVFFFGDGERLEITHRVGKRSVFADGALKAAEWLALQNKNRVTGLFDMRDVLVTNP